MIKTGQETITPRETTDPFSHDLLVQAKRHICFLQTLHACGITQSEPNDEMFRRYSKLWLPLLVKHQNQQNHVGDNANKMTSLIPPSDIAWMWHCHRLAPFRYMEYIRENFGSEVSVLDPDLPFMLQHDQQHLKRDEMREEYMRGEEENVLESATYTQTLWKTVYPHEPFFINDTVCSFSLENAKKKTRRYGYIGKYNLASSMKRQACFLWQISSSSFRSDEFLQNGVQNYHKFLLLRNTPQCTSKDSNTIIVPTFQIDLFWHTHILTSIRDYNRDCRAITGRTLNHDDSLDDRSEGSLLDRSYAFTAQLWKYLYGEDYAVEGAMYRGEPPVDYFDENWPIRQCGDAAATGAIPTGPYLTLIGKVGASSSGVLSASASPPEEWVEVLTNPVGKTPDGEPGFIPASSKSRQHGVNANERKENYIFGKGSAGDGYYHILTKDAYKIMTQRLEKRLRSKKEEMNCLSCYSCMCPIKYFDTRKKSAMRQIEELENMISVSKARAKANRPNGIVGMISEKKVETTKNAKRSSDSKQDTTNNDYYTSDGVWLFPVDLSNAAACGGGHGSGGNIFGGGGCGGGAACGGGGGCGGG
eukprot:CAMPEP_0172498500 /NCGR_PEP_ID=MMETSP1066-20121228/113471_1 /TAXON_ID=671091 /ORGANISM="Coscinodiscus wailesii, Strain CCMP2513" /LENGTH=587 /DNA_ID=CAMNT_0013271793 /DNA_START=54 /DNA_END=1813 /DNA_ORIENTATION=+